MYRMYYGTGGRRASRPWLKYTILAGVALLLVATLGGGAVLAFKHFGSTPAEKAASGLQFDASVTAAEKQTIRDAIKNQSKTYGGTVTARAETALEVDSAGSVLAAYVPVTNVYATRLALSKDELSSMSVYVPANTDSAARSALASQLGLSVDKLADLPGELKDISDKAVAFVPASELSSDVKLLTFNDAYYLDSFTKGAVFRTAAFSGGNTTGLNGLTLNTYATKDTTLKVNMTGVTALTRLMMKKLNEVKDAKYFSKLISPFLADADITHVSNEVSFKSDCGYSAVAFCAPPAMIDTLKDSGVDLVELTGNHNNDTGNQYNTETINLYHSLGWHTFGGGLNATEGAKPYLADQKGSKVAFLGYNAADAPQSGAVANSSIAGANHYDPEKVRADIASAKQGGNFVIVDVQFSECYAYPEGFTEFPECDVPIYGQKEAFRQIIDMGADMVIGTQAHQPQTYEQYKGKPIYYGLGNLYFEQIQWPGTERGIILSHYFVGGKLVQTRLTPTVYDKNLQTHIMANSDAVALLQRLKTARQTAGL